MRIVTVDNEGNITASDTIGGEAKIIATIGEDQWVEFKIFVWNVRLSNSSWEKESKYAYKAGTSAINKSNGKVLSPTEGNNMYFYVKEDTGEYYNAYKIIDYRSAKVADEESIKGWFMNISDTKRYGYIAESLKGNENPELEVARENIYLKQGETIKLDIKTSDGKDIKWEYDGNQKVVTIAADGTVTAVTDNGGEVVFTATVGNQKLVKNIFVWIMEKIQYAFCIILKIMKKEQNLKWHQL